MYICIKWMNNINNFDLIFYITLFNVKNSDCIIFNTLFVIFFLYTYKIIEITYVCVCVCVCMYGCNLRNIYI